MAESDRPNKRIKLSGIGSGENNIQPGYSTAPKTKKYPKRKLQDGEKRVSASLHDDENSTTHGVRGHGKSEIRTFSQPSVICTGDKGVFVTSDKGREKKCLLDLNDLFLEYLEEVGLDASGQKVSQASYVAGNQKVTQANTEQVSIHPNIEADIAAEMEELRGPKSEVANSSTSHRHAQLITLDIPCVSYLRFPPASLLDPVVIVHKLCLDASKTSSPQQSRFIKRLTPVSTMGKVLSHGLQKACDEVLPKHFGPDLNGEVTSVRFAIRPTIRNNDKLHRDEVIQDVASRIQQLGKDMHKVDLKQYEKGVIVEVYRGWVGVSVVENTSSGPYSRGYEELKRFNLAEIYANR